MNNKKLLEKAKNVYETIRLTLDNLEWRYQEYEDNLVITLGVNGDDAPIGLVLAVDAERQLIRFLSRLNVEFNEETAPYGNIACCYFTYKLNDGSFDYDCKENTVTFRLTASFLDSLISEELIIYLINTACNTVDDFNHHFEAIANGEMTLHDLFNL